jgi:hypothetical protein
MGDDGLGDRYNDALLRLFARSDAADDSAVEA